jgi:ABC-type transport system involved in multi-copper enzyme maturation permease subunit
MNIVLGNCSFLSLITHSIIAGVIYLILSGGTPVEAESQEIMGTKASMENLNGIIPCNHLYHSLHNSVRYTTLTIVWQFSKNPSPSSPNNHSQASTEMAIAASAQKTMVTTL